MLASLTFDPTVDGGMISLSGLTVSSSDAVTLASSVVDGMVDGCYETDCSGACYGDAVVDECGTCDGSGIADGACVTVMVMFLIAIMNVVVLPQKIFAVYAVVLTLVAQELH